MYVENSAISERYRKLAMEAIEEHENLHWLKTADVRIDFLSSLKEKRHKGKATLGECKVIKELYKLYVPYDFVIIIYEPNVVGMDDEHMKLVLYHELLHVNVRDKDGVPEYDTNPHDIEDFRVILEEYGLDWVHG